MPKLDPAALAAIIGALAAITGALVAALSGLLISVINSRHQLKAEKLKQRAEGAREAARLLREKYELAHQTLTRIETESMELIVIYADPHRQFSKDSFPEDASQFYRKNKEHLAKLEMLAGLYIPSMIPAIKDINKALDSSIEIFAESWPWQEKDQEAWEKGFKELEHLNELFTSGALRAKRILEQQSSDLFSQAQGQEPQQS